MSSHGVPRITNPEPRSEVAIQHDLEQIEKYQHEVKNLHDRVGRADFSEDTLELCTSILQLNPEFYTIWNHRRQILLAQWNINTIDPERIDARIARELKMLTALMLRHPKCYWIWNYRLWVLDQARRLLAVNIARSIWNQEMALVSKMLGRDGRNFHGWRYRRIVVAALEGEQLSPISRWKSLAREELQYTDQMIHANLSNFSAWHNRSKLILRIIDEEVSDDAARQRFLDDELSLIHNALIDPYDQSIWFYHATLLASFDAKQASKSIAPNLSQQKRLQYLEGEMSYVQEVLEDTSDCKWVYQTLIHLAQLYKQNGGKWPSETKQAEISLWLKRLEELDPLRKGRWSDLANMLAIKSETDGMEQE